MFENMNGVMPRDLRHVLHHSVTDTVSDLFGDDWDGVTGPVNGAPCLEPIDNDPTINDLLAAENL